MDETSSILPDFLSSLRRTTRQMWTFRVVEDSRPVVQRVKWWGLLLRLQTTWRKTVIAVCEVSRGSWTWIRPNGRFRSKRFCKKEKENWMIHPLIFLRPRTTPLHRSSNEGQTTVARDGCQQVSRAHLTTAGTCPSRPVPFYTLEGNRATKVKWKRKMKPRFLKKSLCRGVSGYEKEDMVYRDYREGPYSVL